MDVIPIGDKDAPSSDGQKILVHAAYPLWRKHLVVTLARAKELQDGGNEVTVSYCNASAGTCAVNFNGNPVACTICQARVRRTAEAAGLKTVPLETSEAKTSELPVLTYSEAREVVEGVNSGVISTFRTMPDEYNDIPVIDRIRRKYFATASRLLKSMKNLVGAFQPDTIEVFNGRHACSKTAIIAAKSFGRTFNTLEVTARQQPIVHLGHLVHDRKGIQRRVMSQPADMDVAETYYSNRRRPSGNKFAKKHKEEFVAPKVDGYRRTVSIFLSSQDEFASLGKEWESPFSDYAPVVHAACVAYPDYQFCVRFHPNQADVASDILSPFEATAALPNVKIYYPTDQVNSYSLMDWSDVVVTFGSTMTVEACWAGKSVIMLGPSYFDELDVSHNPETCEEFVELLAQDLPAKDRQNAARFAYYQCFDQNPLRYVKTGKRLEPIGFRVRHPWLGQLARSSDDILCNVIKAWAKRAVKANQSTKNNSKAA
ncbi:hypothetical protein [Rhodopirellula sp. SWK7]|uniref:capsular polysaccharide export protein, LipB/KpsS family n=1 Tax=Rhodopirellula sp. SWK7 TaxID=595460 RepID=UPI0002BEF4D2|nr:hypothetical protein [Rhodopirellula sp. SWK7]EMI41814.1 hypothetical protein RRSWK_05629 [Rhodopirellula sp. SWK7]